MDTISHRLAPLPLWKAVLLFVATSAPIYAGVYHFIPVLENRGLTFLSSYLICFYPTFAGMLLLALILYWREGNSLSWGVFKSRYRLYAVKGRTWIWVAGLFTFGIAASFGLSFTGKWLASFPLFTPPNFLPSEINPLSAAIPGTFMGTSVHGQWGYAVAYFLGWLCNILGEELLWRGFMLPRQEVSYGRWAWLVHGVLWDRVALLLEVEFYLPSPHHFGAILRSSKDQEYHRGDPGARPGELDPADWAGRLHPHLNCIPGRRPTLAPVNSGLDTHDCSSFAKITR